MRDVRQSAKQCQTGVVMLSAARWRYIGLAVSLPGFASAQSPALLEHVRVHRPNLVAAARAELDACVATSCPSADRLALLTGFLELSEGDATAAATRLAASTPPKGLEPFHAWYLGEAQAWSRDADGAIKTLTKARKTAPKWLAPRIDRRLAELSLEVGQPARARALLDADPEVTKLPELLYTRALAREALKLTALAKADWKALAIRFPTHPHGVAAQQKLEAANAWNLTFDEQITRAEYLLGGGDARGCLAALEGLKAPVEKSKAKVPAKVAKLALLRGQALLSRGKEQDAAAQAALAIAADGPPGIAAPALMLSARRLMRLGDNTAARAAFHRVDDTYPEDPQAEEAGYLAAWMAMNAGELEVAVREFEAFETKHPTAKRLDEARWFRGFSFVRAKNYAAAREVLVSLVTDFPKSSLVPQALYWAARSAELGKTKGVDVNAEYRAVLSSWPGGFYGLLASERLQERGVDAALPFAVEPKSLVVKRPAALDLAAALAETGLYRDAAAEVSRALGQMPSADALTWGHALQALGDFNAAHTIAARKLWGPVYVQRAPEALALMYPRAFRTSVETWAQQHGIEPSLAWAIMRRESAFAPEVTSIADARGLMQLIPPTAKNIAQQLKLPPADAAELYSPEWNIRLGTWYLRALQDRLKHPTLVAGAYNGGPNAVAKWATERGDEPLDLWVEQVPYKETRGYVKQVTVDLFIYRQLYGYESTPLSLQIPPPGDGVNF